MKIIISESKDISMAQIIALYKANEWSAADKPNELKNALLNSHLLISAWDKGELVKVGNAI